MNQQHAVEITSGQRFEFGKNWNGFLAHLNEGRIASAKGSLQEMLEVEDLSGKRFLDVGSGSGLFSLAARCLGANVHSFDYDPQCVACTTELRRRYFSENANWTVEAGSVLDKDYLSALGQFDVVYSWGVLHHTGAMWQALENAAPLVAPGGKLFISLYNDQGGASRRWTIVKRLYNRSPRPVRFLLVAGYGAYAEARGALIRLVRLQNPLPFKDWAQLNKERGMSVWHNLVDWVGGYPFEVAKPEQVFDFFRARKFSLTKLRTCAGGFGCNEYVFCRNMDTGGS